MKADLVRGHLDMLLLAIVEDGPAHGYAILEQLRERSDDVIDLPEGTVYPALHRLEKAGLLASSWDTSTGRRRRVYSVTTRGAAALGAQQREWSRFTRAVQAVAGGGRPWPNAT